MNAELKIEMRTDAMEAAEHQAWMVQHAKEQGS